MKFYYKSMLTSRIGQVDVLDRFGKVVFTIEMEKIELFPKFHIYDIEHNELGFMETKIDSNRLTFPVYINGRYIDYIYQDFEFFKSKLCVRGLCWIIEGALSGKFRIHLDGETLATISPHYILPDGTYEIDITHERDTIMVLAVMIALKCTYLKSSH